MKEKNNDIKIRKITITVIFIAAIFFTLDVFVLINLSTSNTHSVANKKIKKDDISRSYFDITEKINNLDMHLSDKYPIKNINKMSDKVKTKFLLDTIASIDNSMVKTSELQKISEKYFSDFKPYKKEIKDSEENKLYEYKNDKYTYNNSGVIKHSVKLSKPDKEYRDECTSEKCLVKKKIYYTTTELKKDNTYRIYVYKTKEDIKNNNYIDVFENTADFISAEDYQKFENELKTAVYILVNQNDNYVIESVKIV